MTPYVTVSAYSMTSLKNRLYACLPQHDQVTTPGEHLAEELRELGITAERSFRARSMCR